MSKTPIRVILHIFLSLLSVALIFTVLVKVEVKLLSILSEEEFQTLLLKGIADATGKEFTVSQLDFDPLHRLEITNLQIREKGAASGDLLFEAKGVQLRYDLKSITSGTLTIQRLHLAEPKLNLTLEGGRARESGGRGAPPWLRVARFPLGLRIEDLSIADMGIRVVRRGASFAVEGLNVRSSGIIYPMRPRLDLHLTSGPITRTPHNERDRSELENAPPALPLSPAEVICGRMEGELAIRAEKPFVFDLSGWMMIEELAEPLKAYFPLGDPSINLTGQVDLIQNIAQVDEMTLDQLWLSGRITDLSSSPVAHLKVRSRPFPLKRYGALLGRFLPTAKVAGEIGIRKLSLDGPIFSSHGEPLIISGIFDLSGIEVIYPEQDVGLSGLEGVATLEGLSLERFSPISIRAASGISIQEVRYKGVRFAGVSDDLQLSSGPGGLEDLTLRSHTLSPVVTINVGDDEMLRSDLKAVSTVTGNLLRGDMDRLQVDISLGDAVKSTLYGRMKRLGSEGLLIKNRLTVELSQIEPLLSPQLLKGMGRPSLRGTLISDSTLSGKLVLTPGPPSARFETTARLSGVGVKSEAISLDNADATLHLSAGYSYPSGIYEPALSSKMHIDRVGVKSSRISGLDLNLHASSPDFRPGGAEERSPKLVANASFTAREANDMGGRLTLQSISGEADLEGLIRNTLTMFNPSVEGMVNVKRIYASGGATAGRTEMTFRMVGNGPLRKGEPLSVDTSLEMNLHDLKHEGSGFRAKAAEGNFDIRGSYDGNEGALKVASQGDVRLLDPILPLGLTSDRVNLRVSADLEGLPGEEGADLTARVTIGSRSLISTTSPFSVKGLAGEIVLRARAGVGFTIQNPSLEARLDLESLELPTGSSLQEPSLTLNATLTGPLSSDEGNSLMAAAELSVPKVSGGTSGAAASRLQGGFHLSTTLLPEWKFLSPDLESRLTVKEIDWPKGFNAREILLKVEWLSDDVISLSEPLKFRVEADLSIDGLEVEAAQLSAEGIASEFDISASLDRGQKALQPNVKGRIHIQNLKAANRLSLEGILADLNLAPDGDLLSSLQIALVGSVGRLGFVSPQLEYSTGPVPLKASMLADLKDMTFSLSDAEVQLPSLAVVNGQGEINLPQKGFRAELEVGQVETAGLMSLLPERFRSLFHIADGLETASLSLTAEGDIPGAENIVWSDIPITAAMRLRIPGADLYWNEPAVGLKGTKAILEARYERGEASMSGKISVAELMQEKLPDGGVRDVLYDFQLQIDRRKIIHIGKNLLEMPEMGLTAAVEGSIDIAHLTEDREEAPALLRILRGADADLNVTISISPGESGPLQQGVTWSGSAGLITSVHMKGGERLELSGSLQLDDLSLSLGSGMAARHITGSIPYSKTLLIAADEEEARPQEKNTESGQVAERPFREDEAVARMLAPYLSSGPEVEVETIEARGVPLRDVRLHISFEEGALAIDRFRLRALEGMITGSLFVERSGDRHHIYLRSEFAGINTAALSDSSPSQEETELAGNARLDLTFTGKRPMGVPEIELELNLHRIGDRAMEQVLTFIDPTGSNPSVASVRRALKLAAPSKEAYIRIKEGNLSLDVTLKARALAGATIKLPVVDRISVNRLLRFSRVRRSLEPLLSLARLLSAMTAREIVIDPGGVPSLR